MKEKNIIKKLNKYLVTLDYLDRIFITLSALFGTLVGIPVVVGIPVGIALLQLTKRRKKNIIK